MGAVSPYYPITLRTPEERAEFFDLIVYSYARQPEIRRQAQEILADAGVRRPDPDQTAEALFTWIQENLPYILEAGEQIETPAWSLREGVDLGADCDGHAILMATLLESVGIKSALAYWTAPGQLAATHVSPIYWTGSNWRNADTTQQEEMGWVPAGHTYQIGSDPDMNPGITMAAGAEVRGTRTPGTVPQLGDLFDDVADFVESTTGSIYGGIKEGIGAVADAGGAVVRAAAETMRMIPGIGDALADLTVAVLETVGAFVSSTLEWIERQVGRVWEMFRSIVTGLVEWATDWRTWSRLILSVLVCAGGAAAAGTVSGGAGAVAVVTVCASAWAETELAAMALTMGTEELERALGIDLPEYLEPGNLVRVVRSVQTWDWTIITRAGEESAAEAARVAMAYAEAEIQRQAQRLPGALASAAERLALEKLATMSGMDQLPAAARGAIEGAIRSRAEGLAAMGPEELATQLQASARQVGTIPPFDELATDIQSDLARLIEDAGARVPNFSEASARIKAQMIDLAAAKAEVIQTVMEQAAPGGGWVATAQTLARVDRGIDVELVRPIATDLFTEAGLEEVLPLTMTELGILRRAGGWTGDTGARIILEGRYTEDQIRYTSGTLSAPVEGARAVLKYRLQGPRPDPAMVHALQVSGAPIITPSGHLGVIPLDGQRARPGASLIASMASAGLVTWWALRKA